MRKRSFKDDGRRIADMSGIDHAYYGAGSRKCLPGKTAEEGPLLSKAGSRALTLYALLAALTVAGIFLIVFALFILFCIYVWFR
jgi:hypothetical protein